MSFKLSAVHEALEILEDHARTSLELGRYISWGGPEAVLLHELPDLFDDLELLGRQI